MIATSLAALGLSVASPLLYFSAGVAQDSGSPEITTFRVLDGGTGAPLAGVRAEAWTEDFDDAMTLVGETLSRADGSVHLRIAEGGLRSEKIRLRKAGYRSTVDVSNGPPEEILLSPAGEPLRLRVLDLEGAPVANALVRSHQTCSHAPPASAGTTGLDGWVELADFPSQLDHPELAVRPPGHGSLTQLWPPAFVSFDDQTRDEIRVPKRAPVHLRLLDENGRPLARRRVVSGGSPEWTATWTDEDGNADFDALFFSRYVHATLRQLGTTRTIGGSNSPGKARLVVRENGDLDRREPQADDAILRIRFENSAPEGLKNHFEVWHEDGWTDGGSGPFHLPAGRVTVIWGRELDDFGRVEVSLELDDSEDRALVLPAPAPLPHVRVHGPWNDISRIDLQAASSSITLEPRDSDEFAVPAGEEVWVQIHADNGRWLARIPPLASDPAPDGEPELTLRLGAEHELVAPESSLGPVSARVVIDVRNDAGEPVEVKLDVRGFGTREPGNDQTASAPQIEGPPKGRYELELHARGHVPLRREGRLPEEGQTTRLEVVLPRRASVIAPSGASALSACGQEARPGDDGRLRLEGLAPGPLHVVWADAEGVPHFQLVELSPGQALGLD